MCVCENESSSVQSLLEVGVARSYKVSSYCWSVEAPTVITPPVIFVTTEL